MELVYFSVASNQPNGSSSNGAAAKVKAINSTIAAISPDEDPCPTCERYPHPVSSVRALPKELELAFPVRDDGASTSSAGDITKAKNTRIITFARTITSEEVHKQIKVQFPL